MIPTGNDVPLVLREPAAQSSKTYRLHIQAQRMAGYCDGLGAMVQAVYKILSTARGAHLIYSPDYGIALDDLFGKPVSFVYPELARRITEALTWDARISAVDGFTFDRKKGVVSCSFTVRTVLGDLAASKAVRL